MILCGDISFIDFDCTLGVGGLVLTICVSLVACTVGVGVVVVDLFMIVSVDDCCGRFCSVEDVILAVEFASVALEKLFRISPIFSNVLICAIPFRFFLPLSACVRSSIALTIVSTCVKVGWVICLCLKNTVSVILMLLVFFT